MSRIDFTRTNAFAVVPAILLFYRNRPRCRSPKPKSEEAYASLPVYQSDREQLKKMFDTTSRDCQKPSFETRINTSPILPKDTKLTFRKDMPNIALPTSESNDCRSGNMAVGTTDRYCKIVVCGLKPGKDRVELSPKTKWSVSLKQIDTEKTLPSMEGQRQYKTINRALHMTLSATDKPQITFECAQDLHPTAARVPGAAESALKTVAAKMQTLTSEHCFTSSEDISSVQKVERPASPPTNNKPGNAITDHKENPKARKPASN